MTCEVCLVADLASDASLRTFVRYQGVQLEEARAALLPVQIENGELRDRIRELEETVERLNKKVARRRTS